MKKIIGSLRQDLMASLVVFIIAVPLSLGIALASGMPPMAALVTAIIGGLLTGALSGAPLVVSGPAAGLSAMILGFVQEFGVEAIYRIAILAGIMQVIFGVLRLGRFIGLIPKSILEGVLSAIGLTILLGQLHILMGQSIPGNAVKNMIALPQSLHAAFSAADGYFIVPAFAAGILALIVQVTWPKIARRLAWVPAALPATLIGTLAALPWVMPRVKIAALFPHIEGALSTLSLESILAAWPQLFIPALGLAFVASAESLLTARAIDILARKKFAEAEIHSDMEKELIAQGLGNMVSGVLGGMPMTGVMVRSAANFNAGARGRASTMAHGGLIAVSVASVPFVLEYIPLAVLASILVLTGWKLLNLKALALSLKEQPRVAYLWPLTAVGILGTDLLKGFAGGIVIWLLSVAYQNFLRKKSPEKAAKAAGNEELAA